MPPSTTGPAEIRLEKVATRMGKRLEITDYESDNSIRVDPLGLEGLSWQDLDEQAADIDTEAEIRAYSGSEQFSLPHELRFRNEYALAIVSIKDREITVASPKIGYSTELGAEELKWLASRDSEVLSEFLEQPFGPHA